MASFRRSITISSPVETVYAYTQEPANLPPIWPGFEEVGDVQRLPNGGTRFSMGFRIAGIRMNAVSEDLEVEPNRRVLSKTGGAIESTMTWLYEPVDGGTLVTVESEYLLPIPLLGKIAEALLVKANEKDTETMLANLKARLEA